VLSRRRLHGTTTTIILSDILLPIVAETGSVEVGGIHIVAQSNGILAETSEVQPCAHAPRD